MRDEIRELIAEAEAVVAGRPSPGSPSDGSPSEGSPSDQPAAGRAWVSILAHADWVALTELESRFPLDRGSLWDNALVYLASELLAIAGTPERLFEGQRAALIPLELELLAGTCQVPVTARDLVILVRPELARIRSRQAPPELRPVTPRLASRQRDDPLHPGPAFGPGRDHDVTTEFLGPAADVP